MPWMPDNDNTNFSGDAHLSMAIGTAAERKWRPLVLALLCPSRGRHQQSNAARISRNGARTAEIRSAPAGGASSFFVGTDVAYLGGDGNFLRPLVGVEDFDSDVVGIVKAGASTAMGFSVFQTIQNFVYPKGSAWLDP